MFPRLIDRNNERKHPVKHKELDADRAEAVVYNIPSSCKNST